MTKRTTANAAHHGARSNDGFCLFIILFFVCVPLAQGQSYMWTPGTVGDWFTAANWTPEGVPGPGDTVSVTTGSIMVSADVEVAVVSATGGVISVADSLTVTDEYYWTSGVIEGAGVLVIPEAALFRIADRPGSSPVIRQVTVDNRGTTTWTGARLSFQNFAVFRNSGAFDAQSDGVVAGFGTFENLGVFRKTVGSGTTEFENLTTVNNSGNFDLQSGSVHIRNGSSDGSFVGVAGTSLIVSVGYTFEAGTTFDLALLTFGQGTISLNSDHVFGFPVEVARATLQGSGRVTIADTLRWNGGNLQAGDSLIVQEGAVVTWGDDSHFLTGVVLSNYGRILVDGSGPLSLGGAAVLANHGTIEWVGSARLTRNDAASVFSNESGGVLLVDNGGDAEASNIPVNNSGRVEVRSGQLRVLSRESCCTLFTQTAGVLELKGGNLASLAVSAGRPDINTVVRIEGGTLTGSGVVTGDLYNAGIVEPGGDAATAAITVEGAYTQTETGRIDIELAGRAAGGSYDLFVVDSAQLSGMLNVALVRGFVPTNTDLFTPIRWIGQVHEGNFGSVVGLNFAEDRSLELAYTRNGVSLHGSQSNVRTWVDVDGPRTLRPGTSGFFDVTIGNDGVDTLLLPVVIVIDQTEFTLLRFTPNRTLNFDLSDSVEYDPPDWRYPRGGQIVVPLIAPVPPQSRVEVDLKNGCGTIQAQVGSPVNEVDVGRCLLSASDFVLGFVPGYDCAKIGVTAVSTTVRATYTGEWEFKDQYGFVSSLSLSAAQCAIGAIPGGRAATILAQTAGFVGDMAKAGSGLGFVNDCKNVFGYNESGADQVAVLTAGCVVSIDPNDKVGEEGVGTKRFIRGFDPLGYTVYFENLESATAPAQTVVITDTLRPTDYLLSTFEFNNVSFGDTTVTAAGSPSFSMDIDLRPADSLIVRVEGQLEVETGVITWTFTSLDPATMLPVTDALAGFLPPNLIPPEGEGAVSYSIRPNPDLADGSIIGSAARIVFDTNEPIDTDPWTNSIDTAPPTSTVQPLSATQASFQFDVSWQGSDNGGSGIRNYTVFVSTDGGPFESWLSSTNSTTAQFVGEASTTYGFFVIARDSIGNVEETSLVPEAETMTPTGESVDDEGFPTRFALRQNYPNPFNPVTTIRYDVPRPSRVRIRIFDVLGREVRRVVDRNMAPGRYTVSLDASLLASGVYLYKLEAGDSQITRKMLLVK